MQRAVLDFTDASTRAVTVPEPVFGTAGALGRPPSGRADATVGGYAMVSRFLVALAVPPPDGEVAG